MKTIIIDGIEYNLIPKVLFKKGDFVVIQETTYLISKIEGLNVTLSCNGRECLFDIDVLKNARLWDIIKDAKEGDVLADDKAILLFRSIGNRNWKNAISYYAILETNLNNWFSISDDEEYWGKVEDCELKPASKEQRALLFQKMKEAGYEWDAEKKELKKIYQKQVINYPDNLPKDNWELIHKFVNEFRRLPKDKDELNVFIEYVLKRKKPAWSEEEENRISRIIAIVRNSMSGKPDDISWLESLKDRYTWKPSDEQMDALYTYIYNPQYFSSPDPRMELVESIYKDLKKLREE